MVHLAYIKTGLLKGLETVYFSVCRCIYLCVCIHVYKYEFTIHMQGEKEFPCVCGLGWGGGSDTGRVAQRNYGTISLGNIQHLPQLGPGAT